MTLEQLRIFVAVAERLHVTRAAETLNLTQSAASAAIAALENTHQVRLFDRIGRRIELTEAGRIFLDEARAVLGRAAAAELALNELAGMERGSIAIHASQTISNYWLPPLLLAYRRQHPRIETQLVIGNTRQVAQAVLDGSADIGFVEGSVDDPGIAATALLGDRLALVVGRGHPWWGRPAVDAGDLHTTPWVLRERGSGTRAEFESAIAAHGVTLAGLTVVMELPSNEAVRAAVEGGGGATAISLLVTAADLKAGTLHQVEFPFPLRPFHVIWHKDRYRTKAVAALIAMVGTRSRSEHREKPDVEPAIR